MDMEKLSEACRLLGDQKRLAILALLQEQELCVCELVELLQTSQPNVSQHMRKLRDGGLVKEAKRGQWVYYSLTVADKPYLRSILEHLPSGKDHIEALFSRPSHCCD